MTPELRASYEFCRRLARREARNFYGSFLLLPPDRRRAMCALYAFLRHTDDLADSAEPVERRARELRAWRRSLNAVLGGAHPPDAWPGLPALADAVRAHAIPPEHLLAVIDGVEIDLAPRVFATWDDLGGYCDLVATAVGLSCLHIWGFRSEGGRAEDLARACGRALQLTNIIRDVGEDARNGRIYLPADERARFAVDPADLTGTATTPEIRALLRFQAGRAELLFAECRPLEGLVDPVGRPVLRAITGVYHALLQEIVRRDYAVLAGRVRVPAWRKLWILIGALVGRRPGAQAAETVREPSPVAGSSQ